MLIFDKYSWPLKYDWEDKWAELASEAVEHSVSQHWPIVVGISVIQNFYYIFEMIKFDQVSATSVPIVSFVSIKVWSDHDKHSV